VSLRVWILTLCVLSSDLRKICFAPYLPERNYYKYRGVCTKFCNYAVVKLLSAEEEAEFAKVINRFL
jgi:hypothetical protein